ncbi:effector-associated constant component EACC1 [Microbispora bryophytorum]|uniref:Uncharacterized protein n=1 Tax=Microbispora bryophytorum TaxID=1460882 RepID=A0A8H9LCR0_9ACTN|nr:hypothetical protein [Microbispora bryophytorum]MBD3140277.1 hypothetical protein [Microbispora bryophytorum]TQS01997.1 hypothetical protein FLX07_30010 [Microbispora bryophytorum]GGO26729.1 hypothetical protein GCM10011574_59510 [Microbispora bryophytorum]
MSELSDAVDLQVVVEGAEAALHAVELFNWLGSEDELRGRVRPQRRAPEPGEMGASVELLTVAVGSGGAVAVLIQSVCTWLTSRRTDVKVTVTAADGRRIEVDIRRAADPAAVLREVAEQFPAAVERQSES